MEHETASTCHCHAAAPRSAPEPRRAAKSTARSIPGLLLGVLIAFFPKCPVCWAAYMSMLGSVWLARTPYMEWIFPLLIALSGLHLALLLRKSKQKGYAPFLLSLSGTVAILVVRRLFPADRWLLSPGVLLMLSGSLLYSFSRGSSPEVDSPADEKARSS